MPYINISLFNCRIFVPTAGGRPSPIVGFCSIQPSPDYHFDNMGVFLAPHNDNHCLTLHPGPVYFHPETRLTRMTGQQKQNKPNRSTTFEIKVFHKMTLAYNLKSIDIEA